MARLSQSPLFANRLVRFIRRARLGKDRQHLMERWTEAVETGDALQRLTVSSDWKVFETVLMNLQRDSDASTKGLMATPEQRIIAAAQWCAFQAIRRELQSAIDRGKQAQEALASVQATPSKEAAIPS